MDYFLMNETVLKILIKEKKEFILKFLNSLDINIKKYQFFDIKMPKKNMKVDIILIGKRQIINIELNKDSLSLNRNKVFQETLAKLLPDFLVIQVNINLFKTKDIYPNIYNFNYGYNEYIDFITSKNYQEFDTFNHIILDIIDFLNSLDKRKIEKEIIREQEIKANLNNILKY